MAEKLSGVSGRDFLTAIAVADDIILRIGRSVTIPQWTTAEGWFATQLLGFLSGAVVAGRLLVLDMCRRMTYVRFGDTADRHW